ncbi:MAG TPA: hypothetical protein VGB07_22870 [Blastocatellia bacterium]
MANTYTPLYYHIVSAWTASSIKSKASGNITPKRPFRKNIWNF